MIIISIFITKIITHTSSQNNSGTTAENIIKNNTASNLDSASLSGNVGTALYVAPEILIKKINKYLYTQV